MRAWPMMAGMVVAMAAGDGLAQGAPSFPASLEREPLLSWLQRETDIQADRVVAVTPQALTAVVSTFPAGGGQGPRVVIRAEALNGETYARTGALSWHVSLSADCTGHRVKLGETTGYPGRNLLGERRVLRPAENDWRQPEAGTALDNAWRAACDATFRGPFDTGAPRPAASDAPLVTAPPVPRPAPVAPTEAKTIAAKPDGPSMLAPAPRPAPATRPAPSAPRPSPAPKPAAAAASPPVSGGAVSVQVGSFPDQASANAALGRLGDGRPHRVESAVVAGRTWYRAVVAGFASAADAGRYCDARKARGDACMVRAAPR